MCDCEPVPSPEQALRVFTESLKVPVAQRLLAMSVLLPHDQHGCLGLQTAPFPQGVGSGSEKGPAPSGKEGGEGREGGCRSSWGLS